MDDVTTRQKLAQFEKLINYKPNNAKILAFHKSNSKTRLLLGGKRCLPLDYQVKRADGSWAPIDSLQVGDQVLGVCLRTLQIITTTVIAKSYSGKKLVYRLDFIDGTSCRASEEHEFPLTKRLTVTVKQLIEDLKTGTRNSTGLLKVDNTTIDFVQLKQIVALDEVETVDITVDHRDHNFIGESGVVTGNSGKSTAAVVEACWAALGIHPYLDYPEPPLRIRFCSVDFTTSKQLALPMFYQWLPAHAIRKYWADDRILELQNGTQIDFKCFSHDTEVLTEYGWKTFKDLDRTEKVLTVNIATGRLEWQKPIAYWEYDYRGDMVYGQGETFDFCVTPTHNMLLVDESGITGKRYNLRAAMELTKGDAAPASFEWKGLKKDKFIILLDPPLEVPTKIWMAFLGMYLSAGSRSDTEVVIGKQLGWKNDKMREVLNKLPLNVVEFDLWFRISNPQLSAYLKDRFGAENEKCIPKEIKELSKEDLQILFEFLMLSSDKVKGEFKKGAQQLYISSSERLIDDLQEVLVKLGLNGIKSKTEDGKLYRCQIDSSDKIVFVKDNSKRKHSTVSLVPYDGKVYCVTTPNHTVFTRRNGKPLMTSQSYDQDVEKFEGVERHLILMDEEPPQAIYQSNRMRTLSVGGRLVISCTPLHGISWIFTTLYDNPEAVPPYVEHWHMSIYENPHISREEIDAVTCDPAMKDNLEAALYGRFFSRAGLVYPQFSERHIIQPITYIPDDWLVVLGIDPSGGRNPWGVVMCGYTKNDTWIVFDEILKTGTVDDIVKEIKAKLGKRFPPDLAVIDTAASSPQSITGKTVKQILSSPPYGIYLHDAHKDVEAGRLTITELLDPGKTDSGEPLMPRLFVTDNCVHLKRQFRNYIWDNWSPKKADKHDPKERPVKKDDHLLDCYDEKTEILSVHGWKLFKDLQQDEVVATLNPSTWELEYQTITGYVDKYYSGKMFLCESETTNFCITPNHRLYSSRYSQDHPKPNYRFELGTIDTFGVEFPIKKDISKWNGRYEETFHLPWVGYENNLSKKWIGKSSDLPIPMTEWMALLGLYLSDGFLDPKHCQVCIAQVPESKHFKDIKRLLDRLPFEFSYDWKQKRFYCNDKLLYAYCSQFNPTDTKFIPQEFKALSPIFLDKLLYGLRMGGVTIGEDKANTYTSNSARLIDDVKEIDLKTNLGWNTPLYQQQDKSGYPTVNRKRHIQEIDYSGRIYCVEVPNHLIYVRREGSPMWCGNSLRYAVMMNIVYRHPKLTYRPKLPQPNAVTGYF